MSSTYQPKTYFIRIEIGKSQYKKTPTFEKTQKAVVHCYQMIDGCPYDCDEITEVMTSYLHDIIDIELFTDWLMEKTVLHPDDIIEVEVIYWRLSCPDLDNPPGASYPTKAISGPSPLHSLEISIPPL
jgi:hypothetical protein